MLSVTIQTIYVICLEMTFLLRRNLSSTLLCRNTEIVLSFKYTDFHNPILWKSIPHQLGYLCLVFHIFGIAAKIKDTCYYRLKVIIIIIIHWQFKDTKCTRKKVLLMSWTMTFDMLFQIKCPVRDKWHLRKLKL